MIALQRYLYVYHKPCGGHRVKIFLSDFVTFFHINMTVCAQIHHMTAFKRDAYLQYPIAVIA